MQPFIFRNSCSTFLDYNLIARAFIVIGAEIKIILSKKEKQLYRNILQEREKRHSETPECSHFIKKKRMPTAERHLEKLESDGFLSTQLVFEKDSNLYYVNVYRKELEAAVA